MINIVWRAKVISLNMSAWVKSAARVRTFHFFFSSEVFGVFPAQHNDSQHM